MTKTQDKSARPAGAGLIPAATILLLRDDPARGADGLEVFMVVRHHQIDFASGALVFPGGKVDEADRAPGLAGAQGPDAAFRVAAIREAFEECGLLLARPRGGADLVPAARVARMDTHRAALHAGSLPLDGLLAAENLDLAVDCLVPFAHWITPRMMPKRFDTLFYLAAAPGDQVAMHDGKESVDSAWVSPRRVLEEADQGRWTVIFPTRRNLEKLARHGTVAEALEAARREPLVTVEPWVEERAGAKVLCIPKNAGYAITEERLDRAV